MSEIVYLIENAEQGSSLQDIESGKVARIEYDEMCATISSLRQKVAVLENCGTAKVCKSCGGWYLEGYKCDCGRDNTYTDAEWKEVTLSG